ncbi:MAG: glutamate--cysteine ligase [Betaproteobacteria bacterium]
MKLSDLSAARLQGCLRGVEKESLRVRPDGQLALTPHPRALGSALTHPNITTDFSESQLELITGTHGNADALLEELTAIHQFVYRHIGGPSGSEMLWCASMPCCLPEDGEIPLGRYGSSNVGRAKTVYRSGLSYRYGRRMQAISGIHYNFSLPGVSNEEYFGLIRNFRRRSWLLLYLFGASPAVCSTFVEGRKHELQDLSPRTLYAPYATSLRMGRLGYQSDAQSALKVSYNDLANYTASLYDALTKPYPEYEKIGILKDGEYRQLNTTLLQIENEFYSTIRPKRRIRRGERPLHALRERGVEYVEVRLMDLDPFDAVGIAAPTTRFLDAFLLSCLVDPSPRDTPEEIAQVGRNQMLVATRGREPGLLLENGSQVIGLAEWGRELVAGCEPVAQLLDRSFGGSAFRDALAHARGALEDPAALPSSRLLHAMARNHANSYVRCVIALSLLHAGQLRDVPLAEKSGERFRRLAEESLAEQARIEAGDRVDFETFRQRYLSPELLQIDRRMA